MFDHKTKSKPESNKAVEGKFPLAKEVATEG
jgi:hypothetical protein